MHKSSFSAKLTVLIFGHTPADGYYSLLVHFVLFVCINLNIFLQYIAIHVVWFRMVDCVVIQLLAGILYAYSLVT